MEHIGFALDSYLERLHYAGSVHPTEEHLEALHRAQIYTIPFENFDILLGRGIALDPAALCTKLVHCRRGGYCFELNGLFFLALQACGFDARMLLARVHVTGAPTGRGHQLALVTLQGRQWLADVGLGRFSLRAPIPFELRRLARQDGRTFRLIEAAPFGIMLQLQQEEHWLNLYSVDLEHVCPADIAYGNHFTSTHPSSLFTYARVAALARPDGDVSLFNRTLKTVTSGIEQAQELAEGQAYLDALQGHFGIALDAPYEALRPLPG
jgi:N-hydroxyarylamine O-acetyltransferase